MESLCPKTPVFPQNGIASMNADIYFIFLSYGYNLKSERVKKKHNFMTYLKIVNDF